MYLSERQSDFQRKLTDSIVFYKEQLLGSGVTSKVYHGYCNQSKRHLAIKFIPQSIYKQQKQRIDRELTVMMKLSQKKESEHIVQFYGSKHQSSKGLYLILELCETDLQKQLEKQPHMNIKRVRRILLQIFQALLSLLNLDKSTGQRFIHRDIKPANILLNKLNGKDDVKLADFTLSRIVDTNNLMSGIGSGIGTNGYMAPEVSTGKYTEKCDVWSLGSLALELLSGKNIFKDYETFNKYKQTKIIPFSKQPVLEDAWVKLLTNMLNLDYSKRWSLQQAYQYFKKQLLNSETDTESESERPKSSTESENQTVSEYSKSQFPTTPEQTANFRKKTKQAEEIVNKFQNYSNFLILKFRIYHPTAQLFANCQHQGIKQPYRFVLIYLSMVLLIARLFSISSWLKQEIIILGDGYLININSDIIASYRSRFNYIRDSLQKQITSQLKEYIGKLERLAKQLINKPAEIDEKLVHFISKSEKFLAELASGNFRSNQYQFVYNQFVNQHPMFVPNEKLSQLSDQNLNAYFLMRLLSVIDEVIPNRNYQQKLCREVHAESINKEDRPKIVSRIKEINQLPH